MDTLLDFVIFGVIVGAFILYAFRRVGKYDRRER